MGDDSLKFNCMHCIVSGKFTTDRSYLSIDRHDHTVHVRVCACLLQSAVSESAEASRAYSKLQETW